MIQPPAELDGLVRLSRALGERSADYAILAEGNTSARTGEDSFLLKASGVSLADASTDSFVEMSLSAVLALLEASPRDDEELGQALLACRLGDGPRPSVEATLHAIGLTLGGANVVGHTHPTAINAILCSERPELIVAGPLFPDQIVVCGQHPLLVPYFDPGVPLAAEVSARLGEHIERHGRSPKTIYLQNHGFVALGQSSTEILQITQMAVKAARILHGTLAAGGPRPLTSHAAARIDSRPDEHHRQAQLRALDDRR
ncbi:MAG: class II aldolase/adducin family protein [Solirubrobacterales bacterium]|nr:class II aldolase/adducin family protein [Solirubrobacterales bacterium]